MKIRFFLTAAAIFLLPGCSLLDSVDQSLNYTQETSAYIQDAVQFAQTLPAAAEQAVTNPQTEEAIKKDLQEMKDNIANFNGMEAPGFAKDIHQQLVSYNETLMTNINGTLENLNNPSFDLKSLTDSPMIQQINEMSKLLEPLKQLGQ
ncbi:DUF6376 family protein [Paenibacillus lutrae]|uniref:Lipoprotein n=1 Tax=Paenibacillus lutrae TaxID=2078573 RepID=A0A7X3K1F0_9BACL|nr:DUF6376 family protein [Paenibacillus lutrae]MVP02050.1 hypothetical protein [Paenibacillus lutrae]